MEKTEKLTLEEGILDHREGNQGMGKEVDHPEASFLGRTVVDPEAEHTPEVQHHKLRQCSRLQHPFHQFLLQFVP